MTGKRLRFQFGACPCRRTGSTSPGHALDKRFQRLLSRLIGQIAARKAHRDPDFAERMRDWGTELGDAHADGVDQCEASQQADCDGLPECFQRLVFHRAGEAHSGVHHGIVADRCMQSVVPVRRSRIQRRVDVEGELLAEAAFFLE
jgi:hypothetical protein